MLQGRFLQRCLKVNNDKKECLGALFFRPRGARAACFAQNTAHTIFSPQTAIFLLIFDYLYDII